MLNTSGEPVAFYSREYVDELKECVDVRLVYGEEKLECPWHDDGIPSLMPYPDHLYCFACGKRADVIELVQAREGMTFNEAVEYLESYKGRRVPQARGPAKEISKGYINECCEALLLGGAPLDYLHGRGLLDPIIRALKIGWDGENIVIPHFVNGKVENIKYRSLGENRSYNSLKGRGFPALYPWDLFRLYFSASDVVFVCEGEIDCITILQHGVPTVSIPSGANTDLLKWEKWWHRFEHIVLLYDMDEGGQRAVQALTHRRKDGKSTVEKLLPCKIHRHEWDPRYGKDVNAARHILVPQVIDMYRKTKGS